MIEKLVNRAKNGEKEAFEELIKVYQDTLYIIAKSRLKEEGDVLDAVQETIISAYQSIDKLKKVSRFKSWLIKILINKCNYIYNSKKKETISIDSLNETKYLVEDKNLLNLEFADLLRELNCDEKTIIILYYDEKYKTKEIAKILEINESTVRSKLFRAKKKLEKNLKEVL